MAQYTDGSDTFEAMQFISTDSDVPFNSWLEANISAECLHRRYTLAIPTSGGEVVVNPGEWVVKNTEDEIYTIHPDVFASEYTLV